MISGTKKTKIWRITTIAKSETNNPAHVAREVFAGTNAPLGVRATGAPKFSVSIDFIKMPQGAVWIQEIKRHVSATSDFCQGIGRRLLHRHKRADGNFGEKFASSVFGQPDAAV